ncbi:hypothetical protein NPIL_569941 [Nephila pilipes]|uniref:Uncharacterized protein n=1 Tax=Nephila pilipes TaxID=299642 RepID=A0A8X6U725_NEPPI|nr:hypothetical protein NPIL_569941 [Nephila pilipes]
MDSPIAPLMDERWKKGRMRKEYFIILMHPESSCMRKRGIPYFLEIGINCIDDFSWQRGDSFTPHHHMMAQGTRKKIHSEKFKRHIRRNIDTVIACQLIAVTFQVERKKEKYLDQ